MFYGRTYSGSIICRSPPYSYLSDESTCTQDQNDVTKEVEELCEHKSSCNFTLKKETFGKDGCPNVFKYMDLTYKCGRSLFYLEQFIFCKSFRGSQSAEHKLRYFRQSLDNDFSVLVSKNYCKKRVELSIHYQRSGWGRHVPPSHGWRYVFHFSPHLPWLTVRVSFFRGH